MRLLHLFLLIYKIKSGKLNSLAEIESQGLLAVKIAQHLALRVDFFEPEVCLKLSELFSQEFPTKSVPLKKLLINSPTALAQIDEQPFAVASVGQVHFATHDNGTPLVLKFIKGDFEEQLKRDVASLTRFFKVVQLFMPSLKNVFNPIAILEFIKEYSLEELNLLSEIKGQERLKELQELHASHYDLSTLAFPKLYRELSSKKLLVSKRVSGETFKSLIKKKELTYKVVLELFKIHGYFIFIIGEFHGDLHPGNVILGDDGKIYLIDCASVSKSSKPIRENLLYFFFELVNYNYEKAAYYINEMATQKISKSDYDLYVKKFLNLYKDFKGKSVSEVSLTRQMMETIKLAVNSKMAFDQSLFSIIKSLSYLDGMVLSVNPNANVIEDMKSSIEGLVNR